MSMHYTSVAGQISAAYAAKVSVQWDFDAETEQNQKRIRKYCPECKKFDTLTLVKPAEGESPKSKNFLKYRCKSCGCRCKNPATLRSRGESLGGSVRSSRVGRGSSGNKLISAMSNSIVMSAVESQPPEFKFWLLWMYTDPTQKEAYNYEGIVMAVLATRLDKIESEALKGLKAYGDVFQLMHLQMKDFRESRRQDKPGVVRPAFYANAIGRDRSQFSSGRLWRRVMDAIHNEMKELDNTGLTEVSRLIEESIHEEVL